MTEYPYFSQQDILNQKVETAQQRLYQLWQYAKEVASVAQEHEYLEVAFQQLSTALEELQVKIEELQHQNQHLLTMLYDTVEAERQRYQELFEFAPDGYLVTDRLGIIQEANHAATTLLKCPRVFVVGKPLSLFLSMEERSTFWTQLNQLQQLNQLHDWEVRLQPWKGAAFSVSLTVAVIRNQKGELVSLRWLLRDITKRKQQEEQIRRALEQEKELNDLKSRFIKNASHQFRTPLTIIKLSAELLANYPHRLSEENKFSHFQKIREATKQMAQLLDDILLLERAEAGKLEVYPTSLNLAQFCRNLVEKLQQRVGSEYTISFAEQGQCLDVQLDAALLRQILDNLFSNALKYSPTGSTVYFELSCQETQVTFKIQDQGIGIPKEDQLRLFERFHRAKNVGTIPGTGLGLAIVKQFVDLQGGAITVESEVGIGTTFTITLQLRSAE